jgi:D-alanine--poly(phosphoribitol) ligase subunit 2
MIQRQALIDLIVTAVKEINPPTLVDSGIEPTADTRLFGAQGLFDSIGLVSLIVDVEQAVIEVTGKAVTLADERAMSRKHSPFRSVGTMADYLLTLVHEDPR